MGCVTVLMMSRCNRLLLGLVLCAACGSVEKQGALPDGGATDDAGIDAPARGTVHVTVLDPAGTGAPVAGASVVFIDPDGTLVKKATTDTGGKADANVLPGANVTSIVLNGTSYQLLTVLAIQPGDDLTMGDTDANTTSIGNFTVNYPAFTGATQYEVATPCGVTTTQSPAGVPVPTSITFPIDNSCKLTTMELVVIALGANGPLASTSKKAVTFTASGATTITDGFQSLVNVTSTYSNIDPTITGLSVNRNVPDGYGASVSTSAQQPIAATTALSVTGATASTARMVARATSQKATGQIIQNIAGTATTYNVNMATTLLPWLVPPTFDVASEKLSIATDATGTTSDKPDLFEVTMSYNRIDPLTGTGPSFSWQLFGPEAADIVLPAIPADVGPVMPLATDTLGTPRDLMFEADTVVGYGAIRANVFANLALYGGERPPATTVRASSAPALR
jgi:hypothetical protein